MAIFRLGLNFYTTEELCSALAPYISLENSSDEYYSESKHTQIPKTLVKTGLAITGHVWLYKYTYSGIRLTGGLVCYLYNPELLSQTFQFYLNTFLLPAIEPIAIEPYKTILIGHAGVAAIMNDPTSSFLKLFGRAFKYLTQFVFKNGNNDV